LAKFPKKKWLSEEIDSNACGKEADLQSFVDDYLVLRRIKSLRIPDGFFRWLNGFAPLWARAAFNAVFAGQPDNICMIPISDKYCLCLNLELKSKQGSLHGKQKANARDYAWQVARSPEEAKRIIDEFEMAASSFHHNGGV